MAASWQLVDDQRSDGVWLSGGNLELAGRAPVKSFCGHVATAKRERAAVEDEGARLLTFVAAEAKSRDVRFVESRG